MRIPPLFSFVFDAKGTFLSFLDLMNQMKEKKKTNHSKVARNCWWALERQKNEDRTPLLWEREKTLTGTTNTHSICHEKFSSSNLFPWVSVERPLHVEMSSSLSLKEEITLPNARTLQYVMMPQTTCSKTMMPLLPSSSLTQMSGEERERVPTKYF